MCFCYRLYVNAFTLTKVEERASYGILTQGLCSQDLDIQIVIKIFHSTSLLPPQYLLRVNCHCKADQ